MKHNNDFEIMPATKWIVMLAIGFSALAITITSCRDDDDNNPINKKSYTISGNASNSQTVPALSDTTLSGSGTISGSYNPNTHVLTYTSNWTGLSGAPTSAGFYNGASGSTGTAVGAPWTIAVGSTGTGSTTGTMTLTEAQAAQLTSGNWYYSYATAANAGGEIRGQITAEQ